MGTFTNTHPVRIDLMYASATHPENNFGQALYRKDAKLLAYKPLSNIILDVAHYVHKEFGYILVLKDCLRPIEAQALMEKTDLVQANPHWLEEGTRLLSRPGEGAHPRGMAIDVALETKNGKIIDMGTPVDYFEENPLESPAHRDFKSFPQAVIDRRAMLTNAFVEYGDKYGFTIFPLPTEWWDYRLEASFYEKFAPVSDSDLPPEFQITHP